MVRLTREQAVVKLDIDADSTCPSVRELTRLLCRAGYRPLAIGMAVSPSGTGQHVMIHVTPRPRSPFEVVALEAILGGDRNRCAMQLHRARAFADVPRLMRDAWNVLYAPHPQRQRHVTLPDERGVT